MFTVDGIAWSVPCDITRAAEVSASDISGLLLNRRMFNDILGTYMRYEIALVPDPTQMGEYYSLYEILTQPVGEHDFTLPYNGETVQISGRIEDISDIYVRLPGGAVMWKGVSFTVTSNAPTKEITLSESISRGLPALPDVYTPAIGDTYTYTAEGWEATSAYADADTTYY